MNRDGGREGERKVGRGGRARERKGEGGRMRVNE